MKRKSLFLIIVTVLIVLLIATIATACDGYDETLILYNWEDYIDEDVLDEFAEEYEEKYGARLDIQYVKFDVPETLLTKVMKGKYVPDLMCPSEYAIEQLYTQGYLQPINKGYNATNNVDSLFAEKLDATFDYLTDEDGNPVRLYDYMVPYMYGTLGIMYNTDVISTEEVERYGWKLLFGDIDGEELLAKIQGKVFMKNSERDAYAAAAMYLKSIDDPITEGRGAQELINDVSDAMIDAVYEVLSKQANSGILIGYETDDGKEKMLSGKGAVMDLCWSGDAMYAIVEAEEYGTSLDYYAPAIGGNIWFDGWIMHKDAGNVRAAEEFLEFVCRPEIAMRNMMYIGYSSAVAPEVLKESPEAMEVLYDNEYDDDYFLDERVYPQVNADNLSRMGVMRDFGERRSDLSTMWESVKSSTGLGNLWIVIVAVLAVALGLLLFVVASFLITDIKKSRRYIKNDETGQIS